MLNKKKIKELEAEIDFKTQVAETRQERYLAVKGENEKLRADITGLVERVNSLSNQIVDLKGIEPKTIKADPLIWICGEPKKQGWYFVAWKPMPLADYKTTSLYYNPAARCRWMRGEKGNAERFEQEVIAYIEAPEYEN